MRLEFNHRHRLDPRPPGADDKQRDNASRREPPERRLRYFESSSRRRPSARRSWRALAVKEPISRWYQVHSMWISRGALGSQ